MRTLLRLILGLGLTVTVAPAQELHGWWRTVVVQNEQSAGFFIHLGADENGARVAHLTVPVSHARDVLLGPYTATDSTLTLTDHSWELSIAAEGTVLEGAFPPSLVGDAEIAVRFERADAPDPPPVLSPAAEPPAPAWTAHVDSEVWAGLAYDRRLDLLFVGTDDGRVSSFQGRTGEADWSKEFDAPIRATPTLHDGRLYVATDLALHVLEARTGDRIWSAAFDQPLVPHLAIYEPNTRWDHYGSAAAIDKDLVVIGARDGCMYALARGSGARRWRTCTEDIITTTPAITGHAVFFGGFDGSAYALSREDGTQLWKYDSGAPIPRDAVLAGDTVLFGSRSANLLALHAATGEQTWRYSLWSSWVDATPVVRDGVIYLGSSDLLRVLSLDAKTGKERWSSPAPGWTWARVAVSPDAVYAGSVGAQEPFSSREGGLLSLDRQTGALRWIFRPEHAEDSRMFGFGADAVIGDGRLFAVDLEGVVYAFDVR
jgi:outer membrane protein assembly factor BamB